MVDIFNPQRGLAQVSKVTDTLKEGTDTAQQFIEGKVDTAQQFIEGKVDTAQQFIEDKKQSITDYFTREQALQNAMEIINRYSRVTEHLKQAIQNPESTDIPMDITPDDRNFITKMAEAPLNHALRWAESSLDQGKDIAKQFLNSEILPIIKGVEDQLAAFPALRELLPSYKRQDPPQTIASEQPQVQGDEEFRIRTGRYSSQSLENYVSHLPYPTVKKAVNLSQQGLGMNNLYELMPDSYKNNERARNLFVNLMVQLVDRVETRGTVKSQAFLGQIAEDAELMETYGQTNPEVAATKYSRLPEPAIDRKPLVTRPRMEASPDLGLRTGGFATRPSYY